MRKTTAVKSGKKFSQTVGHLVAMLQKYDETAEVRFAVGPLTPGLSVVSDYEEKRIVWLDLMRPPKNA